MHVGTAQSVVNQLSIGALQGTAKKEKQAEAFDYVSTAQSTVTISTFSKQINAFYESLQNIADPEARRLATEGLTAMIGQLSSDPDVAMSSDFMVSMNQLHEEDSTLFQSFFTTAGKLNEGGYNLGGFAHTFVAIEDRDLQLGFLKQSNAIIDDESGNQLLKQDTFGEFLDATNRILNSGLEEEPLYETLESYLERISEQGDLESTRAYAAGFEIDR